MNDVYGIYKLLLDGFLKRELFIPRSIEYISRNIKNFFVVRSGGEVVGCGELYIYFKEIAEVRIFVREDLRGVGIGSKILNALIFEAKELYIDSIFVLSRFVDFFLKRGFNKLLKRHAPSFIFEECGECIFYPEACCEYYLFMKFTDEIKFPSRKSFPPPHDP